MAPGPVFYPRHLDLSKTDCDKLLRQLELEAYAGIVSALRSQGELTKERKNLLTEICAALGITPERHRAEVRRAVNDEKLATIALYSSGPKGDIGWIKEGRRIAPLPVRPQLVTAYVEKADKIAEIIARENATLPEPSSTGNRNLMKAPAIKFKSPTRPPELLENTTVHPFSAFSCANCIRKRCDFADVATSTDDLALQEKEGSLDGTLVPSASDSFVFLPGGTTVKVDVAQVMKEEHNDAYSIKSSTTGSIDFGSVPDISLTGPRGTKRKRKKSVGPSHAKDASLTIKKVIRPTDKQTTEFKPEPTPGELMAEEMKHFFPTLHENAQPKRAAVKRKPTPEQSHERRPPPKSRNKKPMSQAVTIQHTPVPPEHLYAVGSHKLQPPSHWSPSNKKSSGHKQSSAPRRPHVRQGLSYDADVRPSAFQPTSPDWLNEPSPGSYDAARESYQPPGTPPRRYGYSPSKVSYKPPNIVQNTYGKAVSPASKKYRPSGRFSIEKKRLLGTEQNSRMEMAQRMAERGDRVGEIDGQPSHKVFRPGYYTTAPHLESRLSASGSPVTFASPTPETRPQILPYPHSGLEELASASLMASELSTAAMVKTGLAPVSAIVSRVTSPAPGRLSPMMVTKTSGKSTPVTQTSKEAGSGGPSEFSQPESDNIPTKHGSSFANTTAAISVAKIRTAGDTSTIQPRSVVVIDSKQSAVRQEMGSIVTIGGQHPSTQLRLAASESSGVPISLSSMRQMHTHAPRVISTIAAKPHKVLKSSTGNVITVTAKSLTGMKTHPTIVSGTSVVKPLGQKTSIIVVHKASGSKLGKLTSESLAANDPDGSKDITITRNLTTPSVILPRPLSEGAGDLCAPGSALGSIQGLVSGLSSSGEVGLLKKSKFPGVKPKFVTMPVQKKMIPGKFEPSRAKVLGAAPGKVLVKTSANLPSFKTTGKLRAFSGSRIVKQVASQTGAGVPTSISQTPGQDIVAAALSQSLGASAVCPPKDHDSLVGLGGPVIKLKQEGLPSSGVIKVATSTPAASTIKAFAATYQKNSSASQQKQILSLSPVQKPVSSVSIHASQAEKTKIFLASPGQQKTQHMLFTPNQPLIHRSPQGTSLTRPKVSHLQGAKPHMVGTPPSHLATIGTLNRPLSKIPPHRIAQQGSHPQTMQVKVISQASTSQASVLRHPWQATSLLGPAKARAELDESTVQTKILQDILDSSQPSQSMKPQTPEATSRGDRATFIYQYHPTSSFTEAGGSSLVSKSAGMEGSDVIMLRSVASESDLSIQAPAKAQKIMAGPSELVKINLSSISSAQTTVAEPPVLSSELGISKDNDVP